MLCSSTGAKGYPPRTFTNAQTSLQIMASGQPAAAGRPTARPDIHLTGHAQAARPARGAVTPVELGPVTPPTSLAPSLRKDFALIVLGEFLDRAQHIAATDLANQTPVFHHREAPEATAQKALGDLNNVGFRRDGLNFGIHIGTDYTADRLVISPREDTAQAVALG